MNIDVTSLWAIELRYCFSRSMISHRQLTPFASNTLLSTLLMNLRTFEHGFSSSYLMPSIAMNLRSAYTPSISSNMSGLHSRKEIRKLLVSSRLTSTFLIYECQSIKLRRLFILVILSMKRLSESSVIGLVSSSTTVSMDQG